MNSLKLTKKLTLICCCWLFTSQVAAQVFNAQSDLFEVLQGSCHNFLDVTENDNLSGAVTTQIQIISQPANGTASINGSYITYCANATFKGIDQFKYLLSAAGQLDSQRCI